MSDDQAVTGRTLSAVLVLVWASACLTEVEVGRFPLPETAGGTTDAGTSVLSPSTSSTTGPPGPATSTPTPPNPTPPIPTPVPPQPQRSCDSSLDCGSGQFCKDRGDGVELCMGDGPRGHFCVSSIDCDRGFCKDRGDGLNVCMGDGQHGDACASSIDCDRGFCKDPGNGLDVCMHEGAKGQLCASSIDCASGLFCRGGSGGLSFCQ